MKTLKVVVGSTNESKVGAVKEFFKRKFNNSIAFEISGIKTLSAVNAIPIGQEGILGCNNRINCIDPNNDIRIAFEGTFMWVNNRYWLQDVVVVDYPSVSEKRIVGGGQMYEIPYNAYLCAQNGLSFHDILLKIGCAEQKSEKEKQIITLAGLTNDFAPNRIETQITALEDAFKQINGLSKKSKIFMNKCHHIDDQSQMCKNNFYKIDNECELLLKNFLEQKGVSI